MGYQGRISEEGGEIKGSCVVILLQLIEQDLVLFLQILRYKVHPNKQSDSIWGDEINFIVCRILLF